MSTYQDVEMGDESKHQGVNITSEKSDAGVVVRGVDSPEGTVHRALTTGRPSLGCSSTDAVRAHH